MSQLIIFFAICSFFGWLAETIYCFIIDKKFTYRGFLYGPVCPIYGFGAVIIYLLLGKDLSFSYAKLNVVEVFFGGMILASILEYITSYILEKVFHVKLWDYSEHRFNINGRVCLLNSTLFGLLGVCIVEFVEPMLKGMIGSVSSKITYPLAVIITIIFLIDLTFTVAHLLHLKENLLRFEDIKAKFKNFNIQVKEFTKIEYEKIKVEIRERKKKGQDIKKLNELMMKLDLLKNEAKQNRRILKAFPNAKHIKDNINFKEFKDFINK